MTCQGTEPAASRSNRTFQTWPFGFTTSPVRAAWKDERFRKLIDPTRRAAVLPAIPLSPTVETETAVWCQSATTAGAGGIRKAPERGRVAMLTFSRTNRVLGHARLSPGLGFTDVSSPHPSPPCSRNTRVTKTLAQTKFPSSSSAPDEFAPHSCPSSIPPSSRCCTWAGRSAAGGCGLARRCPPEVGFPSAGKAAEEFLQFLGEHFEKLLLPVLWQNHHVVLTVPPHMGLATPIFHWDPPRPSGPSSAEDHFICSQETAEPVQFSPPEAVD